MQQFHREHADERGLLGGLRDHGVARRQSRRDLPEENREREIPRSDRHDHAARAIKQAIILSGGAGKSDGRAHDALGLARIETQEIDRLADLGDAIIERLARLALQQRDEATGSCFKLVAAARRRVARNGAFVRPQRWNPSRAASTAARASAGMALKMVPMGLPSTGDFASTEPCFTARPEIRLVAVPGEKSRASRSFASVSACPSS